MEGPVTFVALDETEDRMGDVIVADKWELETYQRNLAADASRPFYHSVIYTEEANTQE